MSIFDEGKVLKYLIHVHIRENGLIGKLSNLEDNSIPFYTSDGCDLE